MGRRPCYVVVYFTRQCASRGLQYQDMDARLIWVHYVRNEAVGLKPVQTLTIIAQRKEAGIDETHFFFEDITGASNKHLF